MSVFPENRLRLQCDPLSDSSPSDLFRGGLPVAYRGADLAVELALRPAAELADISNLTSVTFQVKSAAAITSSPLMSKTVTTGFQTGLTEQEWASKAFDKYHFKIEFTGAETALDMNGAAQKNFHLVIFAVTSDSPTKKIILDEGPISFVEPGAGTAADSVDPITDYYSKAEVDALITGVAGGFNFAVITGDPEGVTTAPVGAFRWSSDLGQLFIKLTGSGNTGWNR